MRQERPLPENTKIDKRKVRQSFFIWYTSKGMGCKERVVGK